MMLVRFFWMGVYCNYRRRNGMPTCVQGMKFVKCGELSSMWDYRKKQKHKIELLESFARQTTRDGTNACMLHDETASAGPAGRLKSVEMTQR